MLPDGIIATSFSETNEDFFIFKLYFYQMFTILFLLFKNYIYNFKHLYFFVILKLILFENINNIIYTINIIKIEELIMSRKK